MNPFQRALSWTAAPLRRIDAALWTRPDEIVDDHGSYRSTPKGRRRWFRVRTAISWLYVACGTFLVLAGIFAGKLSPILYGLLCLTLALQIHNMVRQQIDIYRTGYLAGSLELLRDMKAVQTDKVDPDGFTKRDAPHPADPIPFAATQEH